MEGAAIFEEFLWMYQFGSQFPIRPVSTKIAKKPLPIGHFESWEPAVSFCVFWTPTRGKTQTRA